MHGFLSSKLKSLAAIAVAAAAMASFAALLSLPASAQSAKSTVEVPALIALSGSRPAAPFPRWKLEMNSGIQCFPGFLFAIQKGVEKSPDRLCGIASAPKGILQLTPSSAFVVGGIRSSMSGKGAWMRKSSSGDEASAEGITGSAIGTTTMRIMGVTTAYRRTFFPASPTSLTLEAGTGAGLMKVKFNGNFYGRDALGNDVFEPSVHDRTSQWIPMALLSLGAHQKIGRGANAFIEANWNTGYAVYGGIGINLSTIRSSFKRSR